jgi:hypothetical protein
MTRTRTRIRIPGSICNWMHRAVGLHYLTLMYVFSKLIYGVSTSEFPKAPSAKFVKLEGAVHNMQ